MVEEANPEHARLAESVKASTVILTLPETKEMVEAVADLTVIYFKHLIESGIPEQAAITITAAYSGQIAALRQ